MSTQFWFVCKDKECRGYFSNVSSFIAHKKDKHSSEFQITNCFVFDEREKPLFPSQDENCTASSSLQFLVNKEVSLNESQRDSAAVKIKTEPCTQVQPESILPDPLVTTSIAPQLLGTYVQTNNSISHLDYDAGTELSAFAQHHNHYNYHIVSTSEQSNFDAFIETDVNPQSNFIDAAHYYSNNTDHISNFSVIETGTHISADCNIQNQPYLEIIPKTEIIVFDKECYSAENAAEIADIKDNASNGIKILNNPIVRLKRLTAKEIQIASFLKYRQIETDGSANSHTYPYPKSREVELLSICNLCCKTFESVRALKLHLNECSNVHTNREIFCVVCNKLLPNPVNFWEHCLTVHRLKREEFHLRTRCRCQLCAKDFNAFAELRSHTKIHLNRCRVGSDRSFKGQNKLRYKCTEPGCTAKFQWPCWVKRHLKLQHKNIIVKKKE